MTTKPKASPKPKSPKPKKKGKGNQDANTVAKSMVDRIAERTERR